MLTFSNIAASLVLCHTKNKFSNRIHIIVDCQNLHHTRSLLGIGMCLMHLYQLQIKDAQNPSQNQHVEQSHTF